MYIIPIKKTLADLAETKREDARKSKSLSVSDDKFIMPHREYWLSCQRRHEAMAAIYDGLRESLP